MGHSFGGGAMNGGRVGCQRVFGTLNILITGAV